MTKALTILSNDPSIPAWIDFDRLRSEGLRHIAAYSGDIWTDHNLHDPGVAILEVLCYALADLGYRNSLDVEDLLAPKPGNKQAEDNFFSAAEILTSNPLTITDYRKMLMDVEGVRNAWLEVVRDKEVPALKSDEDDREAFNPKLNGLYKVILELDPFLSRRLLEAEENPVDAILRKVEKLLHQHRNLCEDFDEIILLGDEEIGLCGDIEIDPDEIPEEVVARMMVNLQNFFSPPVTFYTLGELLEKKKRIEDIFEGRPFSPASHGFIDTEELENLELKKELHASDLYNVMMNTPGVRAVRRLKMFNFIGGARQSAGDEWCLKLRPGYRPVISGEHSEFRIFKNVLRFELDDKEKVTSLFQERLSNFTKSEGKPEDLNRPFPVGRYRPDLGEYRSIQHEFPLNYRIGRDELPKDTPIERVSQKLQLKGYLMFYDQMLANYLAQLSNLRNLFSMRKSEEGVSYFTGDLNSVPELEKLRKLYSPDSGHFDEGDTIAVLKCDRFFSTPEARDMAVRQCVKGYQNGRINIVTELAADGRYRFQFSPPGSDFSLVSTETYRRAGDAEKAAEPVYFLAALGNSYQPDDNREEEKYGFKIVNNPKSYQKYIARIMESPQEFIQRRHRFLDHLLARFTEEFTDYTLLMYALEEKKREEQKIIKDKEAFLANYPELSRNRSRAFNFKSGEPVWNSTNVSGMERRVAALMGIDKWERNSMCNFVLASKNALYYAEIRNRKGELIFRSTEGRQEENDAKADLNRIKELLKSPGNYKPLECEEDGIFSFRLEDGPGTARAHHPITNSSLEAVRKKIEWLSRTESLNTPTLVETAYSRSGWFFYLLDEDGKRIFKNNKGYCSEQEVRNAWHNFSGAAGDESNYVKDFDEAAGMFGFSVHTLHEPPVTNFLGWFCTKKQRCKTMKKIQEHIKGRKLNYEIVKGPKLYGWRLETKGWRSKVLLESVPVFWDEEQAKLNFSWFAEMGKFEMRYHDEKDEEGRHAFFVREKDGIIAARSPWFKTRKERDKAKQQVLKLVKQTLKEDKQPPEFITIELPENWSYNIYDEDCGLALEGIERFKNQDAAQWGLYNFLEIAAAAKGCTLIKESDGCRYSFHFAGHCGVYASHPVWYSNEAKARDACERLAKYISANKFNFEIVWEDVQWRFDILWENCAGKIAPLLRSDYSYNKEEEAEQAGRAAIAAFKNKEAKIKKTKKGKCFSFTLEHNDTGECIARHPSSYAYSLQRDKVENDAEKVLGMNNSGLKLSVSADPPESANKAEKQNYVFRLVSKDSPTAAHPIIYRDPAIRESERRRLLRMAQSGALPYSEIYTEDNNAIQYQGAWRVVLRDKTDGGIWWQGQTVFDSEADANEQFHEVLAGILAHARFEKYYRVECSPGNPERWFVVLYDKAGARIASVPGAFNERLEADQAAARLRDKARAYPLRHRKNKWSIEITDTLDDNKLLWEGAQQYEDFADAAKAFKHFLNLATHPANYHFTDDTGPGRYALFLRETFLEDSGIPSARDAAWDRANYFALKTERENGFIPYTQYESGRRYRFRAVNQDYFLAGHTRRYHTLRRREAALEHLYGEAQCRWMRQSSLGFRFEKEDEDKLFFEISINGKWVWRSVKGFSPEGGLGPGHFIGERGTPASRRNYYLDLVECARHAEFYEVWKQGDCDSDATSFGLGLLNPKGELELIFQGAFPSKEACFERAQTLIREFRAYPVLKTEEKYFFQHYTFDEYWAIEDCVSSDETIAETGFRIWESAKFYDTPEAAQSAYNNFLILSKDPGNYRRSADEEDRYFTIEITDPKEILAEHPLAYDDPKERDESMSAARLRLNNEGFHLVEHILLRPDTCPEEETPSMNQPGCIPDPEKAIPYFAKDYIAGECGEMSEISREKKYLPGADPYSFWITIALPWWPARFQNPDFRNFFQNTLRREAPAHVGLRLLWLSPGQMSEFETKYLAWLEALPMPGDCGKCAAQTQLRKAVFEDLKNSNPPPHLDTPGIGNVVVLDQTYL